MPQPKKARGGFPYLWAVAGFCLVGILAYVIRWAPGTEAYDQKVREDRLATLEEIRKAADEKLAGYRWVDQEKKVVGLPIERAMELTVGELKNRPVGPSEVKAVSTGSLIVPPYLKPAAPAQEGTEAAPAPATQEGGEAGAGAGEPAPETAPSPEAGSSTTPEPAAETTPEAAPQTENPAATPAPAADQTPTASPSPAAEPAAPEASAPSQPAATGEGTPNAAETPSAD